MSDDKQKNTNYQTEFSFSFSNLADKVQNVIGTAAETPETAFFEEKIGDETAGRVIVDAGVGKLHIHAGDEPTLLAKVEARHVGKMQFGAESAGPLKTLTIANHVMRGGLRSMLGGFSNRDLYIDVALSPSLPLDLRIESGVGEAVIDVRGLALSDFKLDSGVGPTVVYLPDGDYKTFIDGGVGPITVNLPASAGNKVRIEGGMGPMTLNVPDFADLTLDVEGGIGPLTINLPLGTPLMIEFEGGIGPLSKPEDLVQKQSSIWQTQGYDLAERSVYLKLEGGIGPSRVAFVTPDEKAKPKNDE